MIGLRSPAIARPRLETPAPTQAGGRNVRGGLILLPLGLLGGLAMSLYAFQPIVNPPASLDRYDDLPRRLLRLGHIAAIMLPLINIVLGGWLDRLRLSPAAKQGASWMMLLGAIFLPLALALEAAWEPARHLHPSGLPAIAFCAGLWVVGWGAVKTRFDGLKL